MAKKYYIGKKAYASLDDMPSDIRRLFKAEKKREKKPPSTDDGGGKKGGIGDEP